MTLLECIQADPVAWRAIALMTFCTIVLVGIALSYVFERDD